MYFFRAYLCVNDEHVFAFRRMIHCFIVMESSHILPSRARVSELRVKSSSSLARQGRKKSSPIIPSSSQYRVLSRLVSKRILLLKIQKYSLQWSVSNFFEGDCYAVGILIDNNNSRFFFRISEIQKFLRFKKLAALSTQRTNHIPEFSEKSRVRAGYVEFWVFPSFLTNLSSEFELFSIFFEPL